MRSRGPSATGPEDSGSDAEHDSQIALNRERENALQAYLSAMTTCCLNHNMSDQKLQLSRSSDPQLLPRLDGDQKATVLRFLAGSKLISATEPLLSPQFRRPIRHARGAVRLQLSRCGREFCTLQLPHSSIRDSDLQFADLSDVDLTSSDLFGKI